jgi:hypothetical protein
MKARTTILLFILDLFLCYFTTYVGENGMSIESILGRGLFSFYCLVLVGYLIFTPIYLLIIIYMSYENKRQQELSELRTHLWEKYQNALNSGDKRSSIIYGRQYYSSHGIYDEQRIQNDLLCFLNIK